MGNKMIVTVLEKGKIELPEKTLKRFHIRKGDQLLLVEEKKHIALAKIRLKKKEKPESRLTMLASEKTLEKDWNFKGDDIWDEL